MHLHNRLIKATFWNDSDLLMWPRDKRWFYEGLIQIADDSGCLEDSPFAFKFTLFPSPADADITVELLSEWRDELLQDGKIIQYISGKKSYLYLSNFHSHQSLKNPQKPTVPLPPWMQWETFKSNKDAGKYILSEDVLSDYLVTSEDVLPIQFNSIQVNTNNESLIQSANEIQEADQTDQTENDSLSFKDIGNAFQNEGFGQVTPMVVEKLSACYDDYGPEWILAAMKEAVRQDVRRLSYVEKILVNWKRQGHMTFDGSLREESTVISQQRAGPGMEDDTFLEEFRMPAD